MKIACLANSSSETAEIDNVFLYLCVLLFFFFYLISVFLFFSCVQYVGRFLWASVELSALQQIRYLLFLHEFSFCCSSVNCWSVEIVIARVLYGSGNEFHSLYVHRSLSFSFFFFLTNQIYN
jgi:hypothetical protein